jgi:hypothetical protein
MELSCLKTEVREPLQAQCVSVCASSEGVREDGAHVQTAVLADDSALACGRQSQW